MDQGRPKKNEIAKVKEPAVDCSRRQVNCQLNVYCKNGYPRVTSRLVALTN